MRRYDKLSVKKIIGSQVRSATAVVHSVDMNRVNITLGNTSTLIRGVEVAGDAKKIAPGSVVPITWREGRPVVLQTVGGTSVPSAVSGAITQGNGYSKGVSLEVSTALVVSSGSLAYRLTASQYYGGYIELVTPAVGDYLEWTFLMNSGTYMMTLLYISTSRLGIYQAYLDGIFLDEHDTYSPAAVFNLTWDIPITIPVSGVHTVRFVASGKNASATGYALMTNGATICPTL